MIVMPEIRIVGDYFAFVFRAYKKVIHTSKLYPTLEQARDEAYIFKKSMGWA
ncbi:MAG: hypothetical protein ACTSSE_08665 [Candidatus Thorarchaeota archaeon]